jgi:tetratricopeptide (TPR) repeat protein
MQRLLFLPALAWAPSKRHYQNLSARYGYDVAPPASIVNGLGYELIGAKRFDEAIAAFQLNVALHPDSANPYDSLGDGLAAAGNVALAIENVRKAVDLATKTGDASLGELARHLERLDAVERAGRPAAAPPK